MRRDLLSEKTDNVLLLLSLFSFLEQDDIHSCHGRALTKTRVDPSAAPLRPLAASSSAQLLPRLSLHWLFAATDIHFLLRTCTLGGMGYYCPIFSGNKNPTTSPIFRESYYKHPLQRRKKKTPNIIFPFLPLLLAQTAFN